MSSCEDVIGRDPDRRVHRSDVDALGDHRGEVFDRGTRRVPLERDVDPKRLIPEAVPRTVQRAQIGAGTRRAVHGGGHGGAAAKRRRRHRPVLRTDGDRQRLPQLVVRDRPYRVDRLGACHAADVDPVDADPRHDPVRVRPLVPDRRVRGAPAQQADAEQRREDGDHCDGASMTAYVSTGGHVDARSRPGKG
jgi:hypothetical protein